MMTTRSRTASLVASVEVTEEVLNSNREFLVKRLDGEDLIDKLIEERLLSESAAQRAQLPPVTKAEKNRIIVEQLMTAGPDALEIFCRILRKKKKQVYIAEKLEKSKSNDCTQPKPACYSSTAYYTWLYCMVLKLLQGTLDL